MRLLKAVNLAIMFSFIFTGISYNSIDAAPKKKEVKEQTICPVTGEPIDKKVFTDYKGKRIFFCCADCIKEFKKDPEKYMKKLYEDGATPAVAPGKKMGHKH